MLFDSRRKNHVFCTYDCQQASYRKHGTIRPHKEEVHPFFRCPGCGIKRKLPFNPKQDNFKWLRYTCECGFKPGS